jgi:hypothetical protein
MSILLETATIKESLFPDFDGIIKVLVLGWRFCNGALRTILLNILLPKDMKLL